MCYGMGCPYEGPTGSCIDRYGFIPKNCPDREEDSIKGRRFQCPECSTPVNVRYVSVTCERVVCPRCRSICNIEDLDLNNQWFEDADEGVEGCASKRSYILHEILRS